MGICAGHHEAAPVPFGSAWRARTGAEAVGDTCSGVRSGVAGMRGVSRGQWPNFANVSCETVSSLWKSRRAAATVQPMQVVTLPPWRMHRKRSASEDRKSGGQGKRVSVRVDLGCRRIMKTKMNHNEYYAMYRIIY